MLAYLQTGTLGVPESSRKILSDDCNIYFKIAINEYNLCKEKLIPSGLEQ